MDPNTPTPVGWTPQRVRRSRLFVLVLAVGAAAALVFLHQPWFAWSTPGVVPGCGPAPAGSATVTITLPSGKKVSGIAGRGCLVGSDIGRTAVSAVGTPAGVSRAKTALSTSVLAAHGHAALLAGIPRGAALTIAALAAAAVGVWMRRGWIGVPALLALQVAQQDIGQLRAVYLPASTSTTTVAMAGLGRFTWVLLAGMALVLTSTIFVMKINHDTRKAAREQAKAAGLPEPADLIDPLLAFAGRKLATVRRAAEAVEHAQAPAGNV